MNRELEEAVSKSLRARWTNGAALLALAALSAWTGSDDGVLWSTVLPLVWVAAALYASPIADRRTLTQGEVAALDPSARRVVVYARPGCSWCLRLRLALLGHRPQPVWVDVWADDEASAFVRSVNDGDEVVPTVVIDGTAVTNPPPGDVRAALRHARSTPSR